MLSINVVIPVLNRAHIVGRAIESIVSQALPAGGWSIQVIVVDDGSTDELAGALRPYGTRVTCIRHDKNAGAAAARNTGVAAASCDYLGFLDSDDIWLPGKVAAQIAFMQSNGYPVSCTASSLARSGKPDVVWPRYKTGLLTLADIAWGCILSPGTTMMSERRIFEEIGPFDTRIRRREDWDWLLRLTSRFDLAYLAEPLAYRAPSAFSNYSEAMRDIDVMRAKHLANLPLPVRRSFEAALAYETASARYHQGKRGAAAFALLKSIWLAPVENPALGAMLAMRLARH